MATWRISKDVLQTSPKIRLWATLLTALIAWGNAAYLYLTFENNDLWKPLIAGHPASGAILVGLLVLFLLLPLFAFLFWIRLEKRAGTTSVELLGDRLVHGADDEHQQILFSDIDKVCAIRSRKGDLKELRLLSSRHCLLKLWGLERFEDFFTALKAAAPSIPIEECKLPAAKGAVYFVILLIVITLLAVQGSINKNLHTALLGLILLTFWLSDKSSRTARLADDNLLSSQLGRRYRWIDFAFGAVVLLLLALAIAQGREAVQRGRFVDLISIFFVPLVLGWLFVVPLYRRFCSRLSSEGSRS